MQLLYIDYFQKEFLYTLYYGSVWTKLINKNAMSLHIGVDPRKSISIVHYTELLAGTIQIHKSLSSTLGKWKN